MNAGRRTRMRRRRGSALLLTILFVAIFASLAVALSTAADHNVVQGRNRTEASQAAAMVETGLLLAQRELSGLELVGRDIMDVHAEIANCLQSAWSNSSMLDANGISYDSDAVLVPPIGLTVSDGRSGTVALRLAADAPVGTPEAAVEVQAVGRFGGARHTAYYTLRIVEGGAFSTGLVCAGRLRFREAGLLQGINSDSEGSVLSASAVGTPEVLLEEQSFVSGDAFVVNPNGEVRIRDDGNLLGDAHLEADEPTWPIIDTAAFGPYATEVFTGDPEENQTLVNVRIPAGMNPTFTGNVTVYGVLYIEAPNRVYFDGNTSLCAVVVAEPPTVPDLDTHRVWFRGEVSAISVSNLPDESQFAWARTQTGTFVLAPGYDVRVDSTFGTLPGCMVSGRFRFLGNAAGTVHGWMVSTLDESTVIRHNAAVYINLAGQSGSPAGVSGGYKLVCVPESYRE